MNTTEVQETETFVPVRRAAPRLGVPAAWLKAEALADRLPHLRAGRRLLMNVATVERALQDRAAKAGAAHE